MGYSASRCIIIMSRAAVLLFLLLLAACSEPQSPPQAENEMIESPLQNTVISSADHYPPRPVSAPKANTKGP